MIRREDVRAVSLCLSFSERVNGSEFWTERHRSCPCGVHGTKRQASDSLEPHTIESIRKQDPVSAKCMLPYICSYKDLQTHSDHSAE